MESELVAQLERAEVSEDDLELDSEDMDSEFEEALEEVLEKANATGLVIAVVDGHVFKELRFTDLVLLAVLIIVKSENHW